MNPSTSNNTGQNNTADIQSQLTSQFVIDDEPRRAQNIRFDEISRKDTLNRTGITKIGKWKKLNGHTKQVPKSGRALTKQKWLKGGYQNEPLLSFEDNELLFEHRGDAPLLPMSANLQQKRAKIQAIRTNQATSVEKQSAQIEFLEKKLTAMLNSPDADMLEKEALRNKLKEEKEIAELPANNNHATQNNSPTMASMFPNVNPDLPLQELLKISSNGTLKSVNAHFSGARGAQGAVDTTPQAPVAHNSPQKAHLRHKPTRSPGFIADAGAARGAEVRGVPHRALRAPGAPNYQNGPGADANAPTPNAPSYRNVNGAQNYQNATGAHANAPTPNAPSYRIVNGAQRAPQIARGAANYQNARGHDANAPTPNAPSYRIVNGAQRAPQNAQRAIDRQNAPRARADAPAQQDAQRRMVGRFFYSTPSIPYTPPSHRPSIIYHQYDQIARRAANGSLNHNQHYRLVSGPPRLVSTSYAPNQQHSNGAQRFASVSLRTPMGSNGARRAPAGSTPQSAPVLKRRAPEDGEGVDARRAPSAPIPFAAPKRRGVEERGLIEAMNARNQVALEVEADPAEEVAQVAPPDLVSPVAPLAPIDPISAARDHRIQDAPALNALVATIAPAQNALVATIAPAQNALLTTVAPAQVVPAPIAPLAPVQVALLAPADLAAPIAPVASVAPIAPPAQDAPAQDALPAPQAPGEVALLAPADLAAPVAPIAPPAQDAPIAPPVQDAPLLAPVQVALLAPIAPPAQDAPDDPAPVALPVSTSDRASESVSPGSISQCSSSSSSRAAQPAPRAAHCSAPALPAPAPRAQPAQIKYVPMAQRVEHSVPERAQAPTPQSERSASSTTPQALGAQPDARVPRRRGMHSRTPPPRLREFSVKQEQLDEVLEVMDGEPVVLREPHELFDTHLGAIAGAFAHLTDFEQHAEQMSAEQLAEFYETFRSFAETATDGLGHVAEQLSIVELRELFEFPVIQRGRLSCQHIAKANAGSFVTLKPDFLEQMRRSTTEAFCSIPTCNAVVERIRTKKAAAKMPKYLALVRQNQFKNEADEVETEICLTQDLINVSDNAFDPIRSSEAIMRALKVQCTDEDDKEQLDMALQSCSGGHLKRISHLKEPGKPVHKMVFTNGSERSLFKSISWWLTGNIELVDVIENLVDEYKDQYDVDDEQAVANVLHSKIAIWEVKEEVWRYVWPEEESNPGKCSIFGSIFLMKDEQRGKECYCRVTDVSKSKCIYRLRSLVIKNRELKKYMCQKMSTSSYEPHLSMGNATLMLYSRL